jgi:Xaa-Pro aminopeptidase
MARAPRSDRKQRGGWPGSACLLLLALGLPAAAPAHAQPGSPAGPVPPELLAARRAALLERVGSGLVVLASALPREPEDHPQDSEYREDNDFFYFTGLEEPGAWLVLRAAVGVPEAVLFLQPRNPVGELWSAARLGPGAEATRLTGIADVRSVAEWEGAAAPLIRAVAAAGGSLFVRLGERDQARAELRALLALGLPVEDLRPHLAALRVVKDADELRRLRRAIDITTEAQRAALDVIAPGAWEYEIEAVIEYTFRRRGAERVGFPSIVGSGPNSTVLHYDLSRRQLEAGDLVVIDVGAEFGYYTADVTRTLPASGTFSPRQRALYELVLGAQEAAIAAVRPGVTFAELDARAREYMRRNSGTLCGAATCDRFFVHGVGHFLGMNVHDVGDYGQPLAVGMVITIEPGIYLPEEEIGIRIEDNVLVTGSGAEVLSGAAPRLPVEIERLMRERGGTR